jgi:hypothetical protein
VPSTLGAGMPAVAKGRNGWLVEGRRPPTWLVMVTWSLPAGAVWAAVSLASAGPYWKLIG